MRPQGCLRLVVRACRAESVAGAGQWRASGGDPAGGVVSARDMTRLTEAEAALRAEVQIALAGVPFPQRDLYEDTVAAITQWLTTRAEPGPREGPGHVTSGAVAAYRKRPVVIEAAQYRWGEDCPGVCYCQQEGHGWPHVHTPEGVSYGLSGDEWIIKGVKGEFYPCKPDIFAATYEPVHPVSPPPPGAESASA
jgi:hypothetical protein